VNNTEAELYIQLYSPLLVEKSKSIKKRKSNKQLSLPTTLVVWVEQLVWYVYVWTFNLNEMTSDLDIWQAGSTWYYI